MPVHEQIRKILAGGLPDSLILVGGQSALYYAERFRAVEPFLERFAAVTSRDSDFLGNWSDCEFLAEKLGAVLQRSPRKGGFLGLSLARIFTETETKPDAHFVEVLGSVLGVRQRDVEQTALRVSSPEGTSFRVIHPVLLLEAKASNVVALDQTERNDVAHLGIACFASRAILREMNLDPSQGRKVVTLGNRILDLAESNLGRSLLDDLALDLTQVVPATLKANHPSLENWIQQGLPSRLASISELAKTEGLLLGTPLETVFASAG